MKLLTGDALRRFQNDWALAKDSGNWTQAKMAKALGIAQPSLNQYLKGKIPLNVEFLLQYAKVRRVDPISLGVEESFSRIEVDLISLPVEFSTSGIFYKGEKTRMVASVPTQEGKLFLVEVDSDFRTYPKGAFLVCSQANVRENNQVVGFKGSSVVVGTLKKTPDGWAVIQPLTSGDTASTIDKSWAMAKIVGINFPLEDAGEEFGA